MKCVIIGNGISGVTAARWIRKLSVSDITIISSETPHFYSRTALMYIYMGHMRFEDTKPYEDWFWEKNRISLVQDHVHSIDFKKKTLQLGQGKDLQYDRLILALGSKSNKFGWPGQDLEGVGGLYHFQDLEKMEAFSPRIDRAVVVGGGLIGIEMAEMFRSRNIDVTMLVRESDYWNNILPPEESKMIGKHILDHHIDLRLGVNLQEIKSDDLGQAKSVIVKETGEEINCQFVGLTAGVSPNIGFLKNTELETNRGILVDKNLKTNLPDVYAIGDCAELKHPNEDRRAIEAVWYTGRMMGETVAYNICDKPVEYDPGIWFNSAKFLDIEYQVYGDIRNHIPDGQKTLLWQHPTENKSIRVNYTSDNKSVTGFNLMGIRYRHEVCEKWLRNKTHIEEVLKQLRLANFDPEFFKSYEASLIDQYNKNTGQNIRLKSRRRLSDVFRFLNKKN